MSDTTTSADTDNTEWTRVRYDVPVERVARITLARPEAANAQDYLMLTELNQAFDRAVADEDIRERGRGA